MPNTKVNIEKIKKILSHEAKNTLGLFLRIAPENELTEGEAYKIMVVMLVHKDDYEDGTKVLEIIKGFDTILSLLSEIEGIELIPEGSKIQSLDDISVHRYQELRQLDFDYLSYLNDEEMATIAEIAC